MKLEVNDEVSSVIGLSESELLEVLAVSLYKLEKINGVQGGKLVGTSEIEFHGLLGKYGQFINYNEDDLDADMDNLKDFLNE
jgi:predicted HTH domain antitoxin